MCVGGGGGGGGGGVQTCFFFQAEDGIRDRLVTGVQTCALPISLSCTTSTLLVFGSNVTLKCISIGFN